MESVIQFIVEMALKEGMIITVGVFIIGELVKTFNSKKLNQFIPVIGVIMGITFALIIPSIMPDTDVVTKAILGGAFGWTATGAHEALKNILLAIKSKA